MRRSRLSNLLVIILVGSACTTWHLETIAPQSLVADQQPAEIRVARPDGSNVVLHDPVIQGDTLAGTSRPEGRGEQIRILLGDVRQVETRQFSGGKTVGLLIGLGLGAYAVYIGAFLIACGTEGCD